MANKTINGPDIERASRIRRLMVKKKLRQTDIARAINVSRSTVNKWLSGENTPAHNHLVKLTKFLETTSEWILYAEGSSQVISNIEDNLRPSIDTKDELPIYVNDMDIAVYEGVLSARKDQLVKTDKKVTVDSTIALKANADLEHIFCYYNNDSCLNPVITEGAQCLIDGSKKIIKDGYIYLIMNGVLLQMRCLYRSPSGSLIIHCLDNVTPDYIVEPDQLDTVDILGWAYSWTNVVKW